MYTARRDAPQHFEYGPELLPDLPGVRLVRCEVNGQPIVFSTWSLPAEVAEICGDAAGAAAGLHAIDKTQVAELRHEGVFVDLGHLQSSGWKLGPYYVLFDKVSAERNHRVLHMVVRYLEPRLIRMLPALSVKGDGISRGAQRQAYRVVDPRHDRGLPLRRNGYRLWPKRYMPLRLARQSRRVLRMLSRANLAVSASRVLVCDDTAPRSHGTGRVCTAEGCTTVLSRYNPSPLCCLHSQGWVGPDELVPPRRHQRPRPVLVGNCLNPRCQAEFVTTNPSKKYCSDRCRMQAFQIRVAVERTARAHDLIEQDGGMAA